MAISAKAGKITISGSSFSVTGVGFQPKAVLFIWSDASAEDTWTIDSTAILNTGMGMACYRNSVSNATIINTCVYEISQSNDLASTQSFSHCVGTRATRNFSVGYRFLVTSFDADGFTMGTPVGITNTGHVGKFIYYLALANTNTAMWWYDAGHTTFNVGWEPSAFIDLGSSDYVQNYEVGIQWADLCHTQRSAGRFSTIVDDQHGYSLDVYSGVTDGISAVNNPRWAERLNSASGLTGAGVANVFFYAADSIGSGFGPHAVASGASHVKTTTTTITTDHGPASPSTTTDDSIDGPRIVQLLMQADTEIGEIIPSTTPGNTVSVEFNNMIDPVAVILFCGQGNGPVDDDPVFNGTDAVNSQVSVGFLTPSFQCNVTGAFCNYVTPEISFGVHRQGPAARFMSSSKSWVSNVVSPIVNDSIGSTRMLGTAVLTSTGIDFTTTENSADGPRRILYFAIGTYTTPPETPNLTASCEGPASDNVILEWTEPDDGGFPITGYNIYRGLTVGTETLYASVGPSTLTYTDASEGIRYYYYVRSVNANGESGASNEVFASCVRPGLISFHHDHTFAFSDGT